MRPPEAAEVAAVVAAADVVAKGIIVDRACKGIMRCYEAIPNEGMQECKPCAEV